VRACRQAGMFGCKENRDALDQACRLRCPNRSCSC
jgi:hypothetical protein